jgi:hypothetical protein
MSYSQADINILSSNIVLQLCDSSLALLIGDVKAVVSRVSSDVFVVSHDGD